MPALIRGNRTGCSAFEEAKTSQQHEHPGACRVRSSRSARGAEIQLSIFILDLRNKSKYLDY
ncbi:MAG: hypothetical protein JXN64_01610 [Spirochaetes bacterium]|nr:hypothetical protein [Spirochaetota bacterium]